MQIAQGSTKMHLFLNTSYLRNFNYGQDEQQNRYNDIIKSFKEKHIVSQRKPYSLVYVPMLTLKAMVDVF